MILFIRSNETKMAAAEDVDGPEIIFWHAMGGVNGQAIDELVKRFNTEFSESVF